MASPSVESSSRPQGRLTDHIGLGVLSAQYDRDLLEEVLNRTGRREQRSRRLPAHVMIRYVIAMGLFFAESYDEVMRRLVGNLRRLGSWVDGWQVPTASAITPARQRWSRRCSSGQRYHWPGRVRRVRGWHGGG